MMLEYQLEMEYLSQAISGMAGKLKNCNWTCVDSCATTTAVMKTKIQCLELCGCYSATAYQYAMDPEEEATNTLTLPLLSLASVK